MQLLPGGELPRSARGVGSHGSWAAAEAKGGCQCPRTQSVSLSWCD